MSMPTTEMVTLATPIDPTLGGSPPPLPVLEATHAAGQRRLKAVHRAEVLGAPDSVR
jgi:hypothetical protein